MSLNENKKEGSVMLLESIKKSISTGKFEEPDAIILQAVDDRIALFRRSTKKKLDYDNYRIMDDLEDRFLVEKLIDGGGITYLSKAENDKDCLSRMDFLIRQFYNALEDESNPLRNQLKTDLSFILKEFPNIFIKENQTYFLHDSFFSLDEQFDASLYSDFKFSREKAVNARRKSIFEALIIILENAPNKKLFYGTIFDQLMTSLAITDTAWKAIDGAPTNENEDNNYRTVHDVVEEDKSELIEVFNEDILEEQGDEPLGDNESLEFLELESSNDYVSIEDEYELNAMKNLTERFLRTLSERQMDLFIRFRELQQPVTDEFGTPADAPESTQEKFVPVLLSSGEIFNLLVQEFGIKKSTIYTELKCTDQKLTIFCKVNQLDRSDVIKLNDYLGYFRKL